MHLFWVWSALLVPFASSQVYLYDPKIAHDFAALASVPYCHDIQHVMNWTCSTCVESNTPLVPGKIRIIDSGTRNATRVMIGRLRDQKGCVVSFRGSDNVENWVRNLQIWEIHPSTYHECEGCRVHSGFHMIWQNIEDSILAALNEVGCDQAGEDNLLYITGHSLGAALTHLAMFSLDTAGWKIAKTYSFEAPRVGNKEFADAFNDRFTRSFPVFRITHRKDPVPHLPPMSFGYTHVQAEIFYNSTNAWNVCPGTEDSKCADQYWDLPALLLHGGDHCSTPLLSNGDICNPDCQPASRDLIV